MLPSSAANLYSTNTAYNVGDTYMFTHAHTFTESHVMHTHVHVHAVYVYVRVCMYSTCTHMYANVLCMYVHITCVCGCVCVLQCMCMVCVCVCTCMCACTLCACTLCTCCVCMCVCISMFILMCMYVCVHLSATHVKYTIAPIFYIACYLCHVVWGMSLQIGTPQWWKAIVVRCRCVDGLWASTWGVFVRRAAIWPRITRSNSVLLSSAHCILDVS